MPPKKTSRTRGIFFSLVSYLSRASLSTYIFIVFGCASIILLTGIIANFKLLFLFFMLIWVFVWLKLKNLLFSSYLTALFSLQFFAPNKYYIQEIIRGADMWLPMYRDGYYLGYGLNIANLTIGISMVCLGAELFQKKTIKFLPDGKAYLVLLISTIGFFLIGLTSSLFYSPFTAASLTWLIQYMELFATAILTYYIFFSQKTKFTLVYGVWIISSLFQFVVSGLQFIRQSSLGLPIEQIQGPAGFAMGLDEVNAIYRVAGSFAFQNQLALMMLIFLILLLPYILKSKQKHVIIVVFCILVTIILTQSRSVWIALCITCVLAIRMLWKEIRYFFNRINWRKLIIYLFAGLASVSYVIIPRVLLSFNAMYEGAGIPIRIRLFTEAFQSFLLNPWIGYGIGTNEYVMSTQNINSVMFVFPTAVHLGILQLLLEIGLIGTFCFLFPFLYIVRSLMNTKTSSIKKPGLSEYTFRFVAGSFVFFIYYLFLPHVGIIEFAYLGIILGFGFITLRLSHE